MIEATTANFTSDRLADSLDYFLIEISGKLQLTDTQRKKAEGHYAAVSDWIKETPSGILHHSDVLMIPHGGLGTDTALKPLSYDEFDLDLIVRLILRLGRAPTVQEIYGALRFRLEENAVYRSILEPKSRCLQLQYAGQFHLDLMPGIPVDPSGKDTRLIIPEYEGNICTPRIVDPMALIKWFNGQCELENRFIKAQLNEKRGTFEQMPILTDGARKPTLKQALQLVKRMRDVYFKNDDDGKKIAKSVMLMVIAGEAYSGETSVAGFTQTVLSKLDVRTRNFETLNIRNPKHHPEDFTASLKTKPARHGKLREFITFAQRGFAQLSSPNLSMSQRSKTLERLFGETVTQTVLNEYAERTASLFKAGSMKASNKGTLVYGAASSSAAVGPVLKVPRHEFYGDD